MRIPYVSFTVIGLLSASAWPAQKTDIPVSLRAAMTEAKPKLGALESWQSAVFDAEAVPQYSRFVRDYRPAPNGVVADIDLESLQGFLAYSGFTASKPEQKKMQVVLKGGKACRKCDAAMPLIKKLVLDRLERRGFQAVFPTSDALGGASIEGPALNERAAELVRQGASGGALLLEWKMLPPDLEHPGEDQFIIRVFGIAQADAATGAKELRSERSLELLVNDGFVPAADRLITDAFTEIGMRILAARTAQPADGRGAEWRVEVAGIRDFEQFSEIKARLQAALKDWGTVEERSLARGQAVWVIPAKKKISELQRALAGMKITSADDESVQVSAE